MNRTASLMATIAVCLLLIGLGPTTVVSAQVVTSFHDLRGSLNGGERLTITEQSGSMTKGRFVELVDQLLRVRTESGGQVDLPEASVVRIDHLRVRRGKGALVGFVGGFVGGLLAVALTPDSDSCCGPSKGTVILPVAGIFGGIGAGIGAVIGALRPDHRLIYLAPGQNAGTP